MPAAAAAPTNDAPAGMEGNALAGMADDAPVVVAGGALARAPGDAPAGVAGDAPAGLARGGATPRGGSTAAEGGSRGSCGSRDGRTANSGRKPKALTVGNAPGQQKLTFGGHRARTPGAAVRSRGRGRARAADGRPSRISGIPARVGRLASRHSWLPSRAKEPLSLFIPSRIVPILPPHMLQLPTRLRITSPDKLIAPQPNLAQPGFRTVSGPGALLSHRLVLMPEAEQRMEYRREPQMQHGCAAPLTAHLALQWQNRSQASSARGK